MKILGFEISFSRTPKTREQPTVAECFVHELQQPENAGTQAAFARHNVSVGEISPSSLPSKYDDIEFGTHANAADGKVADRIVGGKWCRTVGEYKAACDDFYDYDPGYST